MLPTGIITLWYGAIGNIPSGWILCDGDNGTPNLQNRFLVGAGDSFPVGASGGSVEHNHDFTSDPHLHTLNVGSGLLDGFGRNSTSSSEVAIGTTDNANGLPPYHALAYIMKT